MPAEPAPDRPHVNAGGPADVITLDKHRRRGGRPSASRGRWTSSMNPTPPPPERPAPREDRDALASFASSIETSFLEIRQSLTDPGTAAAYRRTLDVWENTLRGCHAQGVIDNTQLQELTGILAGMRQAPDLL